MYYSYNANGERTRVGTTESGDGVTYTRDSRGRLSVLSEVYMSTTYSTTITYNADSQPVTVTRVNGVTTDVTYTAAGEIGSIQHRTSGSTIGTGGIHNCEAGGRRTFDA